MILVDSSIWIAAWRGQNKTITNHLASLIENEAVAINGLIRTELLQGAKDKKHQNLLRKLLGPISVQPFDEGLWDEAATFYLKVREKGITLTTIDSLIATHSVVFQQSLWSLNAIFAKLKTVESSLELYSVT